MKRVWACWLDCLLARSLACLLALGPIVNSTERDRERERERESRFFITVACRVVVVVVGGGDDGNDGVCVCVCCRRPSEEKLRQQPSCRRGAIPTAPLIRDLSPCHPAGCSPFLRAIRSRPPVVRLPRRRLVSFHRGRRRAQATPLRQPWQCQPPQKRSNPPWQPRLLSSRGNLQSPR